MLDTPQYRPNCIRYFIDNADKIEILNMILSSGGKCPKQVDNMSNITFEVARSQVKSSQVKSGQIVYSCIRSIGLHCKYNNTHIQFFLNLNNLYIKILSCKIILSSCVDISLLKLWIDGGFKKLCGI